MKKTKKSMTVGEAIFLGMQMLDEADLAYGHGTDDPFNEACWLVTETLDLPVDDPEPYLHARMSAAQERAVFSIIGERIKTRKPAAYLLQKAYICGAPFYVDERVLVPRSFIGELLCDGKLGKLKPKSILDLCTGSGCLAILAAEIFPKAQVDAADLSKDALAVAKKNVKIYGQKITLHQGDLFKPLKNKKYDLIITNPPYVDAKGMKALPPEYKHEPALALGSGTDGLDIIRRIIKEASAHLNKGGVIVCEIGRGRKNLEKAYPKLKFKWLNTAQSRGEVFRLTREQLMKV